MFNYNRIIIIFKHLNFFFEIQQSFKKKKKKNFMEIKLTINYEFPYYQLLYHLENKYLNDFAADSVFLNCMTNKYLCINFILLDGLEINYELNKTIELENETLETFSNGISRNKRKLNIFELNSESESYFDPSEKRIEDNL